MSRVITTCFCAIAFLAMITFASPASANLLANPGFEDPITSDGPPFVGFWEAFNGGNTAVAQNSTSSPLSGSQSLELLIDGGTNTFAGVFQDVDGLLSGQVGTFSGWHKSLGDAGGIEIRIEWRDSVSDVEITRTPNLVLTPGTEYETFELSDTVPAGADTARVVYAIQSFGAPPNQTVYVDDTSFLIPEPSSASLLLLAGLFLAAFRRR